MASSPFSLAKTDDPLFIQVHIKKASTFYQYSRMTCTFAGLYDREEEPRHLLTREFFSCFPRAGGILAQTKDNKQCIQCDPLISSTVLSTQIAILLVNEKYLRYCGPLTGPHCARFKQNCVGAQRKKKKQPIFLVKDAR